MGDELQSNLENYTLHLEQVKAALVSDPKNDVLLKLRDDITEILRLTKALLDQQCGPSGSNKIAESDAKPCNWKVGDRCSAPCDSTPDAKYYQAVIKEFLADGRVCVRFLKYSHGVVINVSQLRPLDWPCIEPNKHADVASLTSEIKTAKWSPKEDERTIEGGTGTIPLPIKIWMSTPGPHQRMSRVEGVVNPDAIRYQRKRKQFNKRRNKALRKAEQAIQISSRNTAYDRSKRTDS